ncbi:hypothetical protein [Massilia sp. LjRoot122]|uniref:hypothetical protein n=1 Tax=Massilia sp. LjRoot122 TaxID=3342257 RepID=UPI003ECD9F3B
MSLKKAFNIARAIKAAGFKIVGSRSIGTDDGACWEATLAYGTQKLAHASNGGFGGDDEIRYLQSPKADLQQIRKQLELFFAIPEAQDMLKDALIVGEGYSLQFGSITQAQFNAKKAEILANPVQLNDETVIAAIMAMCATNDVLKVAKRDVKSKLSAMLEGDDAKETWHTWKGLDTPANRASVQAHHKVDCFLADLIDGL